MKDIMLDYVDFGDYCRAELGVTCQYGYYMLNGLAGHPELGKGLRITGDARNYHSLRIHKEDAVLFKTRVNEWRKSATK
jgi:hypothetical protein